MFALDQTIDPVRGYFLPFSDRKKKSKTTFRRVCPAAANPIAGEQAQRRWVSEWIPMPILSLLIHVVVDAVIFSLLAGISLGLLYVLRQCDVSDSLEKVTISILLIGDLALLLLSLTRIVIKTLRDV